MQDLYEVLGLAPGADQERVKAAFRELAKRFHPDLNVGDAAAEQRFKELSRAYAVLSDAEARAAYDRRARRVPVRRCWPAIATSLATFLFTVGLAAAAIVWTRDASVSQSGTGEPGRGPAVAVLAAGSADRWDMPDVEVPPAAERNEAIRTIAIGPPAETSASIEPMPQAASTGSVPLQTRGDPEDTAPADRRAESLPASPDASFASWATHRSARFGFALRYPGEVFAAAETTSGDIPVRTFMSRDGRATLLITAGPIADGLTLPKYRRSVMEQRYGGATYDYTPQQSHWFVLSGTRGEEMFYERITFACDGRSLHGWQLRYPLADRAFYDRIVEAMHRGYRHSNGPGARCAGKGEATALSKSPAASAAAKEPAAAQF